MYLFLSGGIREKYQDENSNKTGKIRTRTRNGLMLFGLALVPGHDLTDQTDAEHRAVF